ALLEILEWNAIPHEWNRAENFLVLKETRSRILFRAVEEFERLRGSNLAWFGLDELTYAPEAAWLRLEGRLRDPRATKLCGFAVARQENVSEMGVDARLPLMWALDFNVDPMCAVVAQVDGEQVRVLEEIVLSRASTYDACEEFSRRFPEHRGGLVVYADASGA